MSYTKTNRKNDNFYFTEPYRKKMVTMFQLSQPVDDKILFNDQVNNKKKCLTKQKWACVTLILFQNKCIKICEHLKHVTFNLNLLVLIWKIRLYFIIDI